MEAAETLRTLPPDTMADSNESARLELVSSNPSPDEKGSLYDDYVLPAYASEVDTDHIVSRGKPTQHRDYGTTYPEEWPMLDEHDTRYHVTRCVAERPVSDLWVVKDTAWSTQPEGANTDIARKLMKLGLNVLIKGPEVGSSLPLSESAFNTHRVLDAMEELGHMDASAVALEGYSRGSMIAFGTNAYAEQFDRKILYSNLTDPCVALPIKVNVETAKKAVTLPADIAMLEFAILRGLADPRRGRHLVKTINPTPNGLIQFARTGWPLFNGEAGKMAARTPKDMQATIAFFRRCRVNDWQTYQRILADRPGVRFVRPEGGHGGGLDQRIIGNIAVRFGRLAEQLADGRSPDELDYHRITNGKKTG